MFLLQYSFIVIYDKPGTGEKVNFFSFNILLQTVVLNKAYILANLSYFMDCFSFLIMSLFLAFIWNHVKGLSISVKCLWFPFSKWSFWCFLLSRELLFTGDHCKVPSSWLRPAGSAAFPLGSTQVGWGANARLASEDFKEKSHKQGKKLNQLQQLLSLPGLWNMYNGNAKSRAGSLSCFRKKKPFISGKIQAVYLEMCLAS